MKALANALNVFGAFSTNRGRWTVGELCELTGLSKSQVSKVLAVFRDAGYLQQDPATREYSVGALSMPLAGNYLAAQPLVHESVGPMRRLAREVEQTVVLGMMQGERVLYLLGVEGPHFVDVGSRVGAWLAPHATALGKALFAFSGSGGEPAVPHGALPRFTKNTITDPTALSAQLARARKEGVAYTTGETDEGLAAQAVPVFGRGGVLAGALGLVYPQHLVNAAKRQTYTDLLHDAARQVSIRLGAQVYPFGKR